MDTKHPCSTLSFSLKYIHKVYVQIVPTYVIVKVGIIVFLVYDQFFHSESLFPVSVCFIDGSLPQVYRQMLNLITEQKPNTRGCQHITYRYESYCHYSMRIAVEEMIVYKCFVSLSREAVCSGENPAWCNERATTEETVAPMEESSNRWVRLYWCERTTHNFMRLLLRPLTTCQLCRDTEDGSVSAHEGNHKMTLRQKYIETTELPVSTSGRGSTVGVEPVWEQKTEIIRKIQIKHTLFFYDF